MRVSKILIDWNLDYSPYLFAGVIGVSNREITDLLQRVIRPKTRIEFIHAMDDNLWFPKMEEGFYIDETNYHMKACAEIIV